MNLKAVAVGEDVVEMVMGQPARKCWGHDYSTVPWLNPARSFS